MQVRKVTRDDIGLVVSLNDAVQRIHAEAYPELFKYPTNPSELELFFSQLLDKENNILFIATTESGEAAGYVCGIVNSKPENPFKYESRMMHIDQIAVAPDQRGIGAGSMLVQEIEKYARELGIQKITLDSWMFNTGAHAFFEKVGFEKYRAEFWKDI